MPAISGVVLIFLVGLFAATAAFAQDETGDSPDAARFHLGPLRFTPTIGLTNVGYDTNVFNDAENPKEDRIGAFGPSANLWMRVGRSRVSGQVSAEYLYFETYRNQRAWNTGDDLKWAVPLGRLTPFIDGRYSNAKSRSGYEIDSRARATDESVGVGTHVRVSDAIRIVLAGRRARSMFDEKDTYLGTNLAQALNHRSDSELVQLRYRLTALTTVVGSAEAMQDRFASESFRNSNSIRALSGFELKPSALISGRVLVGARAFDPLDPMIPRFRGPVASVDAVLALRATRLGMKLARDVAYSYQTDRPYYTLLDGGLDLTERIGPSWDVTVHAAHQRLDYTSRRVSTPAPQQADRIRQYGGGLGYRVGHTLRLGLDGIYFRRRSSNVALRDCEGLRVGASITYGRLQ